MKDDEKNGAAITRKATDSGVLGAIKLRPLCHLHLERCIKSNGIPTFCQK
jgi:hypothetical protein